VFEMPLIIILMARTGVIDAKSLAGKRKWVFLIAFIVSAVVTPTTDIFTQSVMALAIYFLYEISILLSYLVRPKQ
jgi:sec-independent protein translocase protein TatC